MVGKAAAFVNANMGGIIAGGSTIFAGLTTTGAIIYDNHRGRKVASIDINSKIEAVKVEVGEVKSDVRVMKTQLGNFNNNLVTIGKAIMKGQDGDKSELRQLLSGLEDCKKSGKC